jgi:transcriptional regulator with XRE-family HTH domain
MDARHELADFLRSRRDRLRPEEYGFSTGRRRSPGLRRAEVAQLAGISIDYYIRLEQGRSARPSQAVLDGLARALKLSADECAYLYQVAASEAPPPRPAAVEQVSLSVRRLLEAISPTPAYVIGRRMDVLAWNDMATSLITDFAALPRSNRNLLWHLFCDPAARSLYVEWEKASRQGIARLRLFAARYPDDEATASLVGELSARSPEFRKWWADYDVQDCSSGRKEFNHPIVGRLCLDWNALRLAEGDDQYLITYTAPAGSPSQNSLDLLVVLGNEKIGPRASVSHENDVPPSD